jgi:hypothetical protein
VLSGRELPDCAPQRSCNCTCRFLDMGDLSFHEFKIFHEFAQHESLMVAEVGLKRSRQFGFPAPQRASGALGEQFRILVAS